MQNSRGILAIFISTKTQFSQSESKELYKIGKENFDVDWLLGDEPFPPGSEPGELGELRGRLLFLLETSKYYQAQHLLTHFPECKSSFMSLYKLSSYSCKYKQNKTKK